MASAKRVAIYNGSSWVDYTPYTYNGTAWVKGHVNVYTGSAWVQIPNWEPVTAQPSPKITVQPTGDIGWTGYVSGNYTLYCSTTYNANSYGVWKAFDGGWTVDGAGWASTAGNGTNSWIGILMPYSLKNIKVTIYNRTRAAGMVGGPISGIIYGNDTASTTGQVQIGSFSGRDGATGGYGNTYTCTNTDQSFKFVRLQISTFDNSDAQNYASVGEMIINGDQAV